MNKHYKIQFNKNEIQILNMIETDNIRKSMMSVYSYFIKLSDNSLVKISHRNFLKKYNHYHQKISLGTLNNRIKKLKELKLISSNENNSVYTLNRFLNENLNTEKDTLDVGITDLDEGQDFSKYESLKNNKNNNIINNTSLCEIKNTSVFENEEEAIIIAKEVLKELKVKSQWIKTNTVNIVKQKFNSINLLGARAYISKIVLNLQQKSKINFAMLLKNAKKTKGKKLKFANYDQRNIDYDAIEDELLEWNEPVKTNKDTNSLINDRLVKREEIPQNLINLININGLKESDFNILKSMDYNILRKKCIKFGAKNHHLPTIQDIKTL